MTEVAYIVVIVLAAIYWLALLGPVWHFGQLRESAEECETTHARISILVPARNEEMNIAQCLAALKAQTLAAEIIVINDHSEDRTAEIVKATPGVRLLNLEPSQTGKKAAIEAGIAAATGEIILTTDADCTPPPQWSRMMAAQLHKGNVLCFGPILMHGGRAWLTALQNIESIAVQSISAGLLGRGVAFTASGASLAYLRHIPAAAGGYANDHTPSGDDVLLLLRTHSRQPQNIAWLHQRAAIVQTAPAAGFSEFLSQRIRWASKYGSYQSVQVRFLGIVIVAAAALPWILCAAAFCIGGLWGPLLVFMALKFAGDFLLLSLANTFFRKPGLLLWFMPLWPLYQLCMPVIAAGALRRKFSWKGRTYKT